MNWARAYLAILELLLNSTARDRATAREIIDATNAALRRQIQLITSAPMPHGWDDGDTIVRGTE